VYPNQGSILIAFYLLVTLVANYVGKKIENKDGRPVQGCQSFLGTTFQNGKIHQIVKKYTK
jgi:hypothetical protein